MSGRSSIYVLRNLRICTISRLRGTYTHLPTSLRDELGLWPPCLLEPYPNSSLPPMTNTPLPSRVTCMTHSSKLLREKTFKVLRLFTKMFFTKFGDVVSFGGTNEQPAKVFSAKILFSIYLRKFSPMKT